MAEQLQRLASSATRLLSGGPTGPLPVPAALDALASYVSLALTSAYFPLHLRHVHLGDLPLARAVVAIALAPLIWNIVAQAEFHTRAISRVVGARPGAYALALWIFCFSVYRDLLFEAAMESQPRVAELGHPACVVFAAGLMAVGGVLVGSSMWKLGVTGTYLGDYFGILMDEKVESFPFNYYDHPMYDGATMCFLGKAILLVSRSVLCFSCVC